MAADQFTEWIMTVDTTRSNERGCATSTAPKSHPYNVSNASATSTGQKRGRKRRLNAKDKDYDRLIGLLKGKYSKKLSELRKRHDTSLSLNATLWEVVADEEWTVSTGGGAGGDQEDNVAYTVKRVKDNCLFCDLMCTECQVCLHSYVCSCADNSRHLNMCTHIHLVCWKLRSIRIQENGGVDASEVVASNVPDYELETLRAAEVAELLTRLSSHPSASGEQKASTTAGRGGPASQEEDNVEDTSDCLSNTSSLAEQQSEEQEQPTELAALVTRSAPQSSVNVDVFRRRAMRLTGEIVGMIESTQDKDDMLGIIESLRAVRPKIEALQARRAAQAWAGGVKVEHVVVGAEPLNQYANVQRQAAYRSAQPQSVPSHDLSAQATAPRIIRLPATAVTGGGQSHPVRLTAGSSPNIRSAGGVQSGTASSGSGSYAVTGSRAASTLLLLARQPSSLTSFRHVTPRAPAAAAATNEWWATSQSKDFM